MPITVWITIGIIFAVVWGIIIIEIYYTPTMPNDYDINKPLTREFLLNRGFCCDSGCKNCPYKK